jgi:transcriptional regulator with XRE-family HTH domain
MDSLGERIKAKRDEEDISAEKLAKILGVTKENIYKWERGSKPSDPQVYNRITNWLNKSERSTNTASSQPTWEEVLRRADDHAATLKEIILETLRGMNGKLTGIDSNLNAVLAGVRKNVAISEAVTKTALKSLARIEKKPEESLIQEADKTRVEALKKGLRQGNQHVADK